MDHSEAVHLNAAEKYLSGELPEALRDPFEEHYFDCVECANDLKALSTFQTASRMVFEEEVVRKVPRRPPDKESAGWLRWWRPLVAVPAIAALVAVVVFQNAVTIPALKQRPWAAPAAEAYGPSFRLEGTTRGERLSTVSVHANESFALDFDFIPAQAFRSYQGLLLDDAGGSVLTFHLPGDLANREVHLAVPAGLLHAGKYSLVLSGVRDVEGRLASGLALGGNEVQRLAFAVEFRP
jgi:hypothetical protein